MIKTEFLNQVAGSADGKIAKVVLNGTYEITKFVVKRVDGSTVTLNYLVPESAVNEINLIELKAPDGAVVSTNAVQVPITADTILVQTIQVQEVK